MTHLTDLATLVGTDTFHRFVDFMKTCEWFSGAPGGFVTNSPRRQVNAFGNGAAILSNGELGEGELDTTYWTGKTSAAHTTLHTQPEAMPPALAALVPALRTLFEQCYPEAQLTDHTYSIAVCNYYSDPDHYIAAHTDCNLWYPHETTQGPVFASITLYPEGEPTDPRDFARFSIQPEGEPWQPVHLPHGSVLTMPSGLRHRVQPHLPSRRAYFRPRINLTFRSTYTPKTDPLLHRMAVSNHTRYYRVPYCLTSSPDADPLLVRSMLGAYQQFARQHGYPELHHEVSHHTRQSRAEARRRAYAEYWATGAPRHPLSNNMVYETFLMASVGR